jgi:hypothetical protein
MNLKELLRSKKFKTAMVASVVPFVAYYLEIPPEVAQEAVYGLVAAILGFAAQDYAKARDALSGAQLDVVGSAIIDKIEKHKGEAKADPEPKELTENEDD